MVKPKHQPPSAPEKAPSIEVAILRAARAEFVARGFDGARMQAIADRAGVNKALLHYYFRSKEKLYDTMMSGILGALWTDLKERLDRAPTTTLLRDRVASVVDVYIDVLSENPELAPLLMRELLEGGERLEKVLDGLSPLLQAIPGRILEALEKETRAGKIRPVDPRQFIPSMLGMILMPFLGRPMFEYISKKGKVGFRFDRDYFDKRREHIVELIFHGLAGGRGE